MSSGSEQSDKPSRSDRPDQLPPSQGAQSTRAHDHAPSSDDATACHTECTKSGKGSREETIGGCEGKGEDESCKEKEEVELMRDDGGQPNESVEGCGENGEEGEAMESSGGYLAQASSPRLSDPDMVLLSSTLSRLSATADPTSKEGSTTVTALLDTERNRLVYL